MCRAGAKRGNKNVFNSSKKQNSEKDESKWQKKWIFAAIGLPLVVIFVLSSRMNFSATNNPIQLRLHLHHVIRQYIDIANKQAEIESRMSAHLLGDPLGEIIKNELRPIQERVASLRIQTSQYENMQRIPGGPTSFIASSLKELDNIINRQLLDVYAKVYVILLGVKQNSAVVLKQKGELVELSSKRLDDRSIREMIVENVTLIKMEMEPNMQKEMEPNMQKEIDDLADKTTLDECVEKLQNFAVLYDRLDEVALKFSTKVKDMLGVEDLAQLEPNTEITDQELEIILPLKDQFDAQRTLIENEKVKLHKYFAVFALFIHRSIQNILKMSEKLLTFVEDERQTYVKLQDMIFKDAKNLQSRVENLQYKYAKRRSEL